MTRENLYARESTRLNQLFAAALASVAPDIEGPAQAVRAGQTLLFAGTAPVALPRVAAGRLQAEVHVGEDGQRVIPVGFAEGEIAMCSHLFSGQPMAVDIVAACDSVVHWLPRGAIESVLCTRPELALSLAQFLAQRLREVQARERVWIQRGMRARLWAALLREIDGQAPAADGTWTVALTHEALADRAAVSRPKLSQALKQLEREGKLLLGRRVITVLER